MDLADMIIQTNAQKKKKKNGNESMAEQIINKTYMDLTQLDKQPDYLAPIKNYVKEQQEDEEEKERTWFSKGAFSDGYQAGDITKTILGTAGDVVVGASKGVFRIGEGLADLASYGVAGVADFIGNDDYAEELRKKAIVNRTDELFAPIKEGVDPLSIIGDKGDSVSEGLGYVAAIMATGGVGASAGLGTAGTTALTTGLTGFSSMGSGMSEAYQGGATDEEALKYGIITGVAEAGSELIFGGLGKAVNAVGFSKGISSLDDALAKKISSKLTSTLSKNLAEYTVKAGAEGAEEVISGIAQGIGKKMTYMSDAELVQILKDENLLEQFIVGTVTSSIAQAPGLVKTTSEGKPFISENTQDSQTQIQGLQQEIAKKTEELNKSQDAREKQIIQETINGLNEELNELTNVQKITDEKELRKQRFTTKETEVSDNQDINDFYKSIEDANRNDTKTTHDFAAFVSNIMKDKGIKARAVNHDILVKEGKIYQDTDGQYKFIKNGVKTDQVANINAFKENGTLNINMDSSSTKVVESIVGHEIAEFIKSSDEAAYNEIKQIAIKLGEADGTYNQDTINRYSETYQDLTDDATDEYVNDKLGELFTNENFVNELSKKPNLLQRIISEVKHLVKMATAGSSEARQLVSLQHKLEKKFKEVYRNTDLTKTSTDTKYSVSKVNTDNQGRTLSEGQQEYFKDSMARDDSGNLEVVYHGTNKAGFMTFNRNYNFYTSSRNIAESYTGGTETVNTQRDIEGKTYERGGVYEGYVNLKNPLIIDAHGENWSGIPLEYIGIENIEEVFKEYGSSYFKEKGKLRTSTNDIVEIIAESGNFEYDGIIFKNLADRGMYFHNRIDDLSSNVYVTFNSNQFKALDNLNPTTDNDIRYSLDTDGKMVDNKGNEVKLEATEAGTHGTLMAIHNLTEQKFEGLIELKGIPLPSIAITKANLTGDLKYGEISVLFDKSTIDPTNKKNEVYNSDIYSTRFPNLGNIINESKFDSFATNLENLGINYGYALEIKERIADNDIDGAKHNLKRYLERANSEITQEEMNELYQQAVDLIQEKRIIRDDVDIFTPSGNRRTLKQRSREYTLDNLVKIMTKKSTQGSESNYVTSGTIRGNMAQKFKNISDIKNQENNIVSYKEMQKIKDQVNDKLDNISSTLAKYHTTGSNWQSIDAALYSINETAKSKKINADALKANLAEDQFNVDKIPQELLQETIGFLNDLKTIPTEYFEAKPQRAVGFDEVQAVIIPNNANIKFKQDLKETGLYVVEYDPNIEGDRQAKINEFDNLKFSLSAENEIAPTGQQGTRFEDMRLEIEEAIAPLQETISNLTEQVKTMQESFAPTSQDVVEKQGQEAFNALTDEDMPMYEKIEPLESPITEENTTSQQTTSTSTKTAQNGYTSVESIDSEIRAINKTVQSNPNLSEAELIDLMNKLEELSSKRNNIMDPLEISKLTPEDASTTPKLRKRKVRNGDKESSFYENVTEKTKMLSEEAREYIGKDENVKYYKGITNEQSLGEAYDRLQKGGAAETTKWFNKEATAATATDVAEGWILLKQYQDSGDYDSMVEVAKKMREMGTAAGQTVQAFNILSRLTPEGMVKYAQSELSEAYDRLVQGKTKEWIRANQNKFTITPQETAFIVNNMKEVQNMADGYEKKVKLAEIQKLIQDKIPPELGQSIRAYMRISMLLNPKTQVRNVFGNVGIVPVNVVADTIASQVDRIIAHKTKVRTTGNIDLVQYTKGFKQGVSQSYNDFKKGINTRNMEGNRFEVTEGKSFNDAHLLGRLLNKIDNFTSFLLDSGDRGFYEGAFMNSINNQKILNNTDTVTQEMIDIATSEALQRTWQDNNKYTQFVMNIRSGLNNIHFKGYGLGDVLIPFAKTPANLTKAIIDYSPVGLVKSITKGNSLKNAIATGQFTAKMQHDFVQDLGKATAGTLLYVLGYALANAGAITGSGDDDKDVKNFLKNTMGVNPYSIKIGDTSFTYDWAQPIAAPFAIMANVAQKSEEGQTLEKAISNSLDVAGNVLFQQSFMESINTVLSNNDGIFTGLIEALSELPSRAIPTFAKQVADMVDGTQRQSFVYDDLKQTAINKVKAKLPGITEELAPSINTLGDEIEKYGGDNSLFNVFLNPSTVNKEHTNEVAEEIYRLYQETGDKAIMPRQVAYYVNSKGEKINLTNEQRAEFQTTSGIMTESNIRALMNSDIYNSLDDTEKAEIVADIVNYSYNKAQSEVVGTELSDTYKSVNGYQNVGGNISDYYLFNHTVNNADSSTKKETAVNTLVGMSITDQQKAYLYTRHYSTEEKANLILDSEIPYDNFMIYDMQEFVADKDSEGDTISGSRKKKVIRYVNSMNLTIAQKAILIKSTNTFKFNTYNKQVIDYVDSLGLSYDKTVSILEELDMTVQNGKVYWD